MCRHCARIGDKSDAKIVHDFMEATARRITKDHPDAEPVKPDDIEIEVKVAIRRRSSVSPAELARMQELSAKFADLAKRGFAE